MFTRKQWAMILSLVIFAALFRIAVAHWLPNDTPGDGIIYAQMARNVLEQHVYSHESQPPYNPSLVRLPGYPIFLAGIYAVAGHMNNGAVRLVQALIDTGTCALIALLAFLWQPDQARKAATAIAALALAAICPFTTIYAATILAEVPTNFLLIAMLVAATCALEKSFPTEDTAAARIGSKRAILWWVIAGLIGAISVFFRPDNGLFVAAIGLTLIVSSARKFWSAPVERSGKGDLNDAEADDDPKPRRLAQSKSAVARMLLYGTVFSLSFALVFIPWTVRNWRLFHVFQPLAPAHADMPGEFVPRGYQLWARSWIDDDVYIAPFLWALDTDPIDVEDVPPNAFDSPEEKARVEELFDKYNHPNGDQSPAKVTPQPSPTPSPAKSNSKADASRSKQPANANSEESGDEDEDESDENADEQDHGPVEMTPEIDAAFAQIARDRISRHRFQYYVWLPLKRARTMWFDTHSQYWPFEGRLLPFDDLDYEGHQQYWLPLFALLTAIYTLLGLCGAWRLWNSGKFAAQQWVILVGLAMLLRLILFSSMENPEPRYLVEFFPMLSVLGGIALGALKPRKTAAKDSG